ncbi:MAG: DUF2062 domain-containing protein [Verrucomicrobiia bacterium]
MTKRIEKWLFAWWSGVKRYTLLHAIRLFRVKGESERIARGFALGLIVNFFPTFGFGVLISGVFARFLGGNTIAGIVGGSILTFSWPLLFYLNMRVGGLLFPSPIVVDEVDDVTNASLDALVWGKTFLVGSIWNSLVVGLFVYLLLRLLYTRIRPGALAWFRHSARVHGKLSRADGLRSF